jgi:hypothetical protein
MILQNPKSNREWRATVGIDYQRFNKLLVLFENAYVSHFGKDISTRLADCPGEVKFKSYRDLLFFTLFSLKSGLGYDVLGYLLEMDASNAKRNQALGLQLLAKALDSVGCMPKREFASVEEFKAHFKEHEKLILDGTEQRFNRPKDKEMQKKMYSGKKKHIQPSR